MQFLRANTAVDVLIGPFVDATDGSTAEIALTLDVELSKLGQALANKNDGTAPTHDAAGTIDGHYNCELDATDTNSEGTLVLLAFDSEALIVRHEYMVLSEAAWDSKYAPKDTGFMDVNVAAIDDAVAAAVRLALSAGQMIPGTVDNTAFTATTTELEADDITEDTSDNFNGRNILWTSGIMIASMTDITDYVLTGGRGHFTVSTMPETPGDDDTFIVI